MSVSISPAARRRFRFSPNPNRAHLIRWFEWGSEAFAVARRENKPVMLFLGAFWCGYCQRMDETALSHDETIALLNAYYVTVRVDEAQRPDIDVRYNQNGWPTIVFMAPDGGYLASVNYLSAEDFGDILVRIHLALARQKPLHETASGAEPAASPEEKDLGGPPEVRWAALEEIATLLLDAADEVHGGYGVERKFPHCEVSNFLLDRYESTGDGRFLEHVTLTLDTMMQSKLHDGEGGFFRYSSRRDWNEPHYEKLLADQAGLLMNYLRSFVITGRSAYKAVVEETVDYLNTGFSGADTATFYGSRDYIRLVPGKTPPPGALVHEKKRMFSIVDDCVYVDANAQASRALLGAARTLDRADCRERALRALEFLWEQCFLDRVGMMAHYFDEEPRAAGLLMDQVCMGRALVEAFELTGVPLYRERSTLLAEAIGRRFRNSAGGYHDTSGKELAHLGGPLTLLTENGSAACFFAALWRATGESAHFEAARWALRSFTGDFRPYSVHAAEYGRALSCLIDAGGSAGRAPA